MNLVNQPVRIARGECFLPHSDLNPGEKLILMVNAEQVQDGIDALAAAVMSQYFDEAPVVVPILRAAEWTAAQFRQRINPTLGWTFSPAKISSTDGQKRLPKLRVDWLPDPNLVAGRPVQIIDGVVDTGNTLNTAIKGLINQASQVGVIPPSRIAACALVLKEAAQKVDLPQLTAVAFLAGENDWVVGASDEELRGMDLNDRFAYGLPGIAHIQI